jgi:hypothetical protein
MSAKRNARLAAEPVAVCGVGAQGFKCAIVSWVAPLLAAGVLVAGMRFPVVGAFNILLVAFGVTALVRSLAHIRRFGGCGIGGHVAVGLILNLIVVTLVIVYVFTSLDPFQLRR